VEQHITTFTPVKQNFMFINFYYYDVLIASELCPFASYYLFVS
jgi:hypothetical protein